MKLTHVKRHQAWSLPCILGACCLLISLPAKAVGLRNSSWVHYGLDTNETRDSPLAQINARNVAHLGLAWSVVLTDEHTVLEGTPLELDGVLYANGGAGAVYAFEATTGRTLWTYNPHANEAIPRGTRRMYNSDRGLAYSKGKIYTCTKDGRMVALDAKSGKVLWSTTFIIPGSKAVSTGAPRAMDGNIIIGTSGSEFASRGYVTAVDAETGKIAWRFFTVPGNPADGFEDPAQKMAAKTWTNEWWKYGGGGAVWNAITYDKELGQVYLGTGNPGPWLNKVRGGPGKDNLFTDSIVALNAKTGRYLWHYQTTPDDVWDFDSTADIILTTLLIDAKPSKVLMQANKNGFFYVIDRVTGKLISADKFARATWATGVSLKTGRPVEAAGARYHDRPTVIAPSTFGAHDWQAMSYSGATGFAYIPVIRAVSIFSTSEAAFTDLQQSAGHISSAQGVDAAVRTAGPRGMCGAGRDELIAWNPVARKVAWRVTQPCQVNGGTLTTRGNLVFEGRSDGYLSAYSADKGRLLWSFDAHMGILAPPITYSVAGQQYVSVLAGYGGGGGETAALGYSGWAWGMPRRLLTFRLGGTAKLASAPQPLTHIKPLDNPTLKLDSAKVNAGSVVYGDVCAGCHGEAVVANGTAPDLRASPVAFNRAAFGPVLRQGLLLSNGMPRFDDLSSAQIDDLYQYIRSRAREDLKAGRNGVAAVVAADPQ